MGIKYITPFLSSGRDNLTVHLDLNLLCVKRLMANRCQDLYKVIQWDLKDTIYTFLRFGKKMSSHWNFLILSNFHFKLFFFFLSRLNTLLSHFVFAYVFCDIAVLSFHSSLRWIWTMYFSDSKLQTFIWRV